MKELSQCTLLHPSDRKEQESLTIVIVLVYLLHFKLKTKN